MSTHVRDHCDTPSGWFRRDGSTWACSCGELWRMDRRWGWERLDALKKENR